LPFAEAAVSAFFLEGVETVLHDAVEALAASWASEVHEVMIEQAHRDTVRQNREPSPVRI
jgi:hypothetical protein